MHVQTVMGQENAHFALGILFKSTFCSSRKNFFAIVSILSLFSAAKCQQM